MASSMPSSRRRPMSPSPPPRKPGGAATFARPGGRRRVGLDEALSAALECAQRREATRRRRRHDLRLLGPAQFQILQRLAGAKQRRQEVIPDVLVGFRRTSPGPMRRSTPESPPVGQLLATSLISSGQKHADDQRIEPHSPRFYCNRMPLCATGLLE